MAEHVIVREASGRELAEGAAMLAAALGFRDRDAIPAWHMQDTCRRGGLALGAFAGKDLVGFSYALPVLEDGGPVLFSSGLAVAPAQRSQGVGRRLKLLQRRLATEHGYSRIDWTADPLSVVALRLYLTNLGARLVGYAVEPYAGLRDVCPHDDVEIRWHLAAEPRPIGDRSRTIELPFDQGALSRAGVSEWRRRMRTDLPPMLADGYEGVGVDVDRAARRCRLLLAR
jgi:predicted GNAT superfamily acetyltransferase